MQIGGRIFFQAEIINSFQQLARINLGFQKVINGIIFKSIAYIGVVVIAAEYDDACRYIFGTHFFQKLQSVHVRHTDVGN